MSELGLWVDWRVSGKNFGQTHIDPCQGTEPTTVCGKKIPANADYHDAVSFDRRKIPAGACKTCVWRQLDHGMRNLKLMGDAP